MQKFFIIFISALILVFGSAFSCSAVTENTTEVITSSSTENSTKVSTSGSTESSTEVVTSGSTEKVHSEFISQNSSVRIFLFLFAQVVFFLLLVLLLK